MKLRLTGLGLAIALLGGIPIIAYSGVTTYQTANVVSMPGGGVVGGAGTLFREQQSVKVNISTSGLDTNAAYTVWWVVWNSPSACSGGCGADDIGIAGNSVFYAAGFLTGTDGKANVSAILESGQLPAGIDVLIPGGLRSGNGLTAEIHLVIRSHGPIIPGSVAAQIGSFNGACNVNTCVDQQAVAFTPVK